MIIEKDHRVYEKFKSDLHPHFVRNRTPNVLVIHGTAGTDTHENLIKWMMGDSNNNRYKNGIGLFNWDICRSGKVYEVIPPVLFTHHAHAGSARHRTMLSVELCNPTRDNKGHYTVEQYSSLNELIWYCMTHYPLTRIMSHDASKRMYAPAFLDKTVSCPGSLDWQIIENGLIDKGVNFVKNFEGNYSIDKP